MFRQTQPTDWLRDGMNFQGFSREPLFRSKIKLLYFERRDRLNKYISGDGSTKGLITYTVLTG